MWSFSKCNVCTQRGRRHVRAQPCEVKSQCAEEERVLPKEENSAFSCPAGRIGGAGTQGGHRLPWRQKPRRDFMFCTGRSLVRCGGIWGRQRISQCFCAGSSVKKPGEPSGPPGRLNMAGAQAAGSKLMLSRAGAPLILPALQALEKLRTATARGMAAQNAAARAQKPGRRRCADEKKHV